MRRREFLVRSSHAAIGCAFIPVCGCAARAARPSPAEPSNVAGMGTLVDHFERQVPEWMREAGVPGVGVAVISQARVAWQGGFGVNDAASQKRVNDRTMFEAASMSKPAFAYVVMKLCETGALNLDTPLTHVLSHTSTSGARRNPNEDAI